MSRRLLALLGALVALGSSARVGAADYYVAPTGSDTSPGTEAAPFASWSKAQSVAAPGDTVYFRGGRYRYTDATSDCGGSTSATVNAIVLSKNGTADKPIRYWAYPGERPVFDFSGITNMAKYNCRQAGVRVTANYLHLKGLEFTGALQLNNLNHESWCVYVYGGSHNLFEQLDAHHNMGPGFFIQRGSDNTFLNCDSHENEDTLTSNGDGQSADGFGCHPNRAGDTGNVFRGCRAWWNTDDGWDFINATEACTVEHSWAWYNGYKPDAVNNGQPVSLSSGNGNGFKGGGYGLPPSGVPANVPQHVLRANLALFNKSAGFYANHSPNSPVFYNNTAFKNGVNYNLLGVDSDGSTEISVGLLRNNLAFGGTATSNAMLRGSIDSTNNSWDAAARVMISNADFQSVAFAAPASCPAAYAVGGSVCVTSDDMTSFAGLASARQPDGSLPSVPFLHLVATSPLVDQGVDVGLAFAGKAPDLGAFEYGADERTQAGAGGAAAVGGASGARATAGTPGAAGRNGFGGAGARGGTGAAPVSGSAGRAAGASTSTTTAGAAGAVGTSGSAGSPEMGAAVGGRGVAAGSSARQQNNGCACQVGRRGGSWRGAMFACVVLCLSWLRRCRTRPGRRSRLAMLFALLVACSSAERPTLPAAESGSPGVTPAQAADAGASAGQAAVRAQGSAGVGGVAISGFGGRSATGGSGGTSGSRATAGSTAGGRGAAVGGAGSMAGNGTGGGSGTAACSGPIATLSGALATGIVFMDDRGKRVNAHGGGIIQEGDTYYLHGEYFSDTTTDNNFNGFAMYSSKDLATWKWEKMILPQQPSGLLGPKRKGERPHIVKCPSTGEYVLYAHAASEDYQTDKEVVYATSPKVNGDYTFVGALTNASGQTAAHSDMSAVTDADKAYVITESGHIYTLAADCHSWVSDKAYSAVNGDSGGSESPTVFKAGNTYYWIGSYKTGWRANNNFYSTAPALSGPWTHRGFLAPVTDAKNNISDERTWLSQSTWVTPVRGCNGTVYVYWGDHWDGNQDTQAPGKHNALATYVFQPLVFTDTAIALPSYRSSWTLDVGAGSWSQ